MLYLILGPSGIGKGTQIELLRKRHPEFVFPKSVTTRKMRPQESEGNPYHFISDEEFEKMIRDHDLLEYAIVHEAARYGTPKRPIQEALEQGKTVIKELDIQGLIKIKNSIAKREVDFLKDNLTSIFIMPPDEETLVERITGRSVIKEDELHNRLESARNEISMSHECTNILNTKSEDSPEEVYKKLEQILT